MLKDGRLGSKYSMVECFVWTGYCTHEAGEGRQRHGDRDRIFDSLQARRTSYRRARVHAVDITLFSGAFGFLFRFPDVAVLPLLAMGWLLLVDNPRDPSV